MTLREALATLLVLYDHLATGGAKDAADKILETALPVIAAIPAAPAPAAAPAAAAETVVHAVGQ